MPTILSIQIGLPKNYGKEGDPIDQPWRSGFFKLPVNGPVHVGKENIAGDGQADLRVHGGPDKAILCYSAKHYPFWRKDLGLPDFPHGAFGENLTIEGLDESSVCIGDTFEIVGSEVRVQVSQPRQPCWKLARRWNLDDLPEQVIDNGKSGWYVRVLREGEIEAGQEMKLIDRPNPAWTIARANELMFHRPNHFQEFRELSNVELLADGWRRHFARRSAGAGE